MGSTYFIFSAILTILLFPKSIAIVSLLILILSDTAAAIIGKWIGRIRIFGKTLEGSMAFLITSLLIVWIYPNLRPILRKPCGTGGDSDRASSDQGKRQSHYSSCGRGDPVFRGGLREGNFFRASIILLVSSSEAISAITA